MPDTILCHNPIIIDLNAQSFSYFLCQNLVLHVRGLFLCDIFTYNVLEVGMFQFKS